MEHKDRVITVKHLYKMFRKCKFSRLESFKLAISEYKQIKQFLSVPVVGATLAYAQTSVRLSMLIDKKKMIK